MDQSQRDAVDIVAFSAYAFEKYSQDDQLKDGVDPDKNSVETILAAAAKTPLGPRLVTAISAIANELTDWEQPED